jgi:hypothetical protein
MMMKKITLIFIFILYLFFWPLGPTLAQKVELESRYVLSRDFYLEAYDNYLSSRQAYLNQPTLERKNILFRSLKSFLYARNKLQSDYLGFLINKIENTLGKESTDKLRSWLVWLSQEEDEINQQQSVEDLYNISSQLHEIYPEMEADIYLQLANYAVINQLKVIEELTFIRDRLKLLTENNNWEEEVNQKIKSAESNQNLGLEIIKEARTRRPGDAKKAWDSTVVYLNRAQEDLDVTFDYLDEVIKRLE